MTTLTVWGPDTPPPDNEELLAFWQQFLPSASPDGWFSIPSEVDQQREALRGTYLAWLHTLGIQRRRGRKLVDRMAIRPGLSYWWMSIPADFSLGTDSPAYKAVRMMALARLANTLGATRIDLVSDDRSLRRLVGGWAEASGRRFTVRAEESPPEALALSDVPLWRRCVKRVYRTSGTGPPLRACRILLGNVVLARRAKSLMKVAPPRDGVALIDYYLAHLGSQVDGFSSNYWGPLVPALEATDVDVWWLHISNGIPSAIFDRDAEFTAGLNKKSAKRGQDLIHAHLTYGVVLRSLRDYLSVAWFGLSYRRKRRSFDDSCSGIPLWPAYMEAFREHFYGSTAMLNCLWLNLFERALTGVPRQRVGIYLFENQPWEMALIHAWKNAGHGRLIGVAHTTTLFWDTRYFKDPRDLWPTGQSSPMPWPDAVAVNGQSMRDACLAAGYPSGRLIDVEALRYFQFREPARAAAAGAIRVLVCGEYSPTETRRLLNMASRALELAEVKVVANFRPHPATVGVQPSAHSRFGLDASPSASEAVDASDIVICGGISSIVIDALARGKPVICVHDPHGFPGSQSGHGLGAYRADTAVELCGLIANARSALTVGGFAPAAELNLDPGLPAWRALVGFDQVHPTEE